MSRLQMLQLQNMATREELSDAKNDEEKVVEKETSDATPNNEELERTAQRELLECADPLNRQTDEKPQQIVQRLTELESELEHVKFENIKHMAEMEKKRKNLEKMQRCLDEHSQAQKQKIAELESLATATERQLRLAKASAQPASEITDNSRPTANGELQRQLRETSELLNRTRDELRETRQRLSEVQERLTVSEQVTAATQQRAVREADDNSEELPLELALHHHPAPHSGLT